jgi:diguanylate cyclase (GGDEF)-like protein/PAS domain S-box-containing protein
MTRDPDIAAPCIDQRQCRAERRRAAAVTGAGAALAAAVAMLTAWGMDGAGAGVLSGLAIAVAVAMVVGLVFRLAWPASLRKVAAGAWHRANAELMLVPAVGASAFFLLQLGRFGWPQWLCVVAAMVALGALAGSISDWVVDLARTEALLEASPRQAVDPARSVGAGVAGLVLLVLAVGAARIVEYRQRLDQIQPASALAQAARDGRQLALHIGHLAGRIEAEPGARMDLIEQLATATLELAREGDRLDRERLASGRMLPAADRERLEQFVAQAQRERGMLLRDVTAFRRALDAGRPLAAEQRALEESTERKASSHDREAAAIDATAAANMQGLKHSAFAGFLLLALVALTGGASMSRATARIIRGQQRAIESRLAEHKRFSAVLRNTRNQVITTDCAGRVTWVNAAFERLTGYTLEEMQGRSPGDVLQCAQTDPATVRRIGDALREAKTVRAEILNQGKQGHRYWIDMVIEPQYDAAGVHVGFMAIESDITESVQLREHHQAFFEAMAAGVVVQDARGEVIDCNQAACRMLGLDADQLRGRRSVDQRWAAIREDGRPFPGEEHYAMHTLRTGEAVSAGVMGVRLPHGGRRWLEVSTRLIEGLGTGERQVIACFTDITERKHAEAQVSLERGRLAAALDGTGASAWFWRVDLGEVTVDPRWAEIIGEPQSTGSPVAIGDWMRRLHPDDTAKAARTVAEHFRGETARYEVELRVRHQRGHWVWVHCCGRLTERAPDGTPRSMFGTLLDISARMEQAYRDAAEQHKLRKLFDLAPIGIALVREPDDRIIDCNQTLARMLRRDRAGLVGVSLRELMPADGLARWHDAGTELVRSGRSGPHEREYLRTDGSRVPVLVSAQRVPLADGSGAVWVIVQDMTERKAMEQGLQREARTDKLTGLANRVALMERLEAAVQRARNDARAGFGLLFLDFDRFKLVNDTLGHEAGDDLLRQIAERLRHALRSFGRRSAEGTFVARIGGDEFVALVDGTADVGEIDRVARRLLATLAAPYVISGSEVQSSASIGVVSSAQCELDASALLRDADTAMYEAKRRGRGVAVMFDEGMRSRVQREVVLERNLRRAVANGELSVMFQPIVDLETGVMTSAEALLRWRSAELGDVSPTEFVPIAEDSGQIIEIGAWVLAQSCRLFAQWITRHPQSRATVSVNLSRIQLGKPELLLQTVERVLDETGLPPPRLQLEVTERDVMRDPAAVLLLMRHLRALGVRLAMDDFGTGTSSLACLRDYPFDVIKIDRAFVGELDTNGQVLALVHATMMLIENLGMTSVAEGVETTAQAAILQSVGCRLGQGWLFGMPEPLATLDPSRRLAAGVIAAHPGDGVPA